MNWIRASRLHELNDRTNDYILSMNYSVASIAFTRVPDSDMEIFCDRFIDKFPNLELWNPNIPYSSIKITGPNIDLCMNGLEEKLRSEEGMFYLLCVFKEPNDTISIKYSKVN